MSVSLTWYPNQLPLIKPYVQISRIRLTDSLSLHGIIELTKSYLTGTGVTLLEATSNSQVTGWGGVCASCGANTSCLVKVDGVKTCSAAFVGMVGSLVKLVVTPAKTFSFITDAYTAAPTGIATIKVQG